MCYNYITLHCRLPIDIDLFALFLPLLLLNISSTNTLFFQSNLLAYTIKSSNTYI